MIDVNIAEQTLEMKARYDEYADLLVRRDQLFAKAESYRAAYTAQFGEQINSNFEIRIECIRLKKAISYCQRRINRGIAIDIANMHAEIDREMQGYKAQQKGMMKKTDEAKKSETAGFLEAGYAPDKEDLEEKIERVERQINDIVTTAPYTYGEILESREKRKAHLSQLEEEHAGFVQYLETLTATLTGLLKNGGTQFIWEMKLK